MKPVCLISDFLGKITFPHYTKYKDEKFLLSSGVVYDPAERMVVGDLVTIHELKKNTRVFSVTKSDGHRLAKGDWSFNSFKPMFCEIEAKHIGFWNPIKDHPEGGTVEVNYITDKKEAA